MTIKPRLKHSAFPSALKTVSLDQIKVTHTVPDPSNRKFSAFHYVLQLCPTSGMRLRHADHASLLLNLGLVVATLRHQSIFTSFVS